MNTTDMKPGFRKLVRTLREKNESSARPDGCAADIRTEIERCLNEARCLSPRTVGNIELAGRIMRIVDRAVVAERNAQSSGWQPIETAPSGTLVVVGWLDPDDNDNPERHDFDYKEEGVWVKHDDLYQDFCCVAPPGSRGPKETAPYTHWLEVPPLQTHNA